MISMAGGRLWSPEEDRFLRHNREQMTLAQLGEKLGRSWRSINVRCSKLGIVIYRPWTEHDEKVLRDYYQKMSLRKLAADLHRTEVAVRQRYFELGLVSFHHYPKGTKCAVRDCTSDREQGPWCRLHYHRWYRGGDPGEPDRRRARHGEGKGRRQAVCNGKKAYKYRVEWEKIHGPIPAGYLIHHKNENPKDDSPDNLQLVTRAEHARLHSKKHQ